MYLEAKTKDPNPKFPMSFGTILAGVNDGRYKNTAISPTAVDIKAIEKVLKKRFGDNTIQFTVIEVHSERLKNKGNKSGRAVIVQSFSNRYVHHKLSKLGSSAKLIEMEDEEWRETFAEMAVFLMGILEQDSVKFWVEDMLTNGETEEHTIRNPGYGQPS